MKKSIGKFNSAAALSLSLAVIAFLAVGCSLTDSPTAANNEDKAANLWNPAPGENIVDDWTPVFVDDTYWEDLYGVHANPFMVPLIDPAPVRVGPEGGTVTCGRHKFTVPAGALDEPTEFTMSIASLNAVGVDCGPSMTFSTPVMLTLSYARTEYDQERGDIPELAIFYMAPDGTAEMLESIVNPGLLTVTARVDHFSRYILGSRLD